MENVKQHDSIVGRGEFDSNMEEDSSLTLSKPNHFSYTVEQHGFSGGEKDGNGFNDEDDEECDSEAWETLSKGFKDVQSVLDQNRDLIRQVNENHQSKRRATPGNTTGGCDSKLESTYS